MAQQLTIGAKVCPRMTVEFQEFFVIAKAYAENGALVMAADRQTWQELATFLGQFVSEKPEGGAGNER